MKSALAIVAVFGLLIAGCEGWAGTRGTDESSSSIVSADRIPAPDGTRAWAVEYGSTSIDGTPTTVTGWVAIPEVPGPIPILGWADGSPGPGEACANRDAPGPFDFAPELEAGWAVAATHFVETAGPAEVPYLVAESEARSILGIAGAARELDDRVSGTLLLWGADRGGHAALATAALAPKIAPDLEVTATVAVAPLVNLAGWSADLLGTPDQGRVLALVSGLAAGYRLDPTSLLSTAGRDALDRFDTSCIATEAIDQELFIKSPLTTQPWADLLRDNSPETMPISSPVLLVIGGEDRFQPPGFVSTVVGRMCAAGTPVATSILIGQDHESVGAAARGEAIGFLAARLTGVPFDPDC